jgi:hypothetical protein
MKLCERTLGCKRYIGLSGINIDRKGHDLPIRNKCLGQQAANGPKSASVTEIKGTERETFVMKRRNHRGIRPKDTGRENLKANSQYHAVPMPYPCRTDTHMPCCARAITCPS